MIPRAARNQLDRIKAYFDEYPTEFRELGARQGAYRYEGENAVLIVMEEIVTNPGIRQARRFVVKRAYRDDVDYPQDDDILKSFALL